MPCRDESRHRRAPGALHPLLFAGLCAFLATNAPLTLGVERDCTQYEAGSRRIVATSLPDRTAQGRHDQELYPSVFEATANACGGDEIVLPPGDIRLTRRTISIRRHLSDRSIGTITVRGHQDTTTIRGGTEAGFKLSRRSMRPDVEEHACMVLDGEQGVVVEQLSFEGCWPIAIHAIDSSFISVRDARIVGSTFGVYAQGRCGYVDGRCKATDNGHKAHHLLVENVEWIQDVPEVGLPAKGAPVPPGRMWRRYWWRDIHHRGRPFHHLNGALLGSWNIRGSVVFRYNRVYNAFNVVRLNVPRMAPSRSRNTNIEVYGNKFRHIRDNIVEPEGQAWNLWIHGNDSVNDYGPLSTDGVGGDFWYIFANTHVFNRAPGIDCERDENCAQCLKDPRCRVDHLHRRGKTLKLGQGPFPGRRFYVFRNSTYQHHPLSAGGETRNLHLFNNVLEVCSPKHRLNSACRGSADADRLCFHESFRFAGNVTNDAGCLRVCGEPETPSVCVFSEIEDPEKAPFYESPATGDLRLGRASPARGAAVPVEIELPDGTVWGSKVQSLRVDAGAFQGSDLLQGPAFMHVDPVAGPEGVFREPPRVVRIGWRDSSLEITFSVPIAHEKSPSLPVSQLARSDAATRPLHGPCRLDGRVLACSFAHPDARTYDVFTLPASIVSDMRGGVLATAGVQMTLWGSPAPRSCALSVGVCNLDPVRPTLKVLVAPAD